MRRKWAAGRCRDGLGIGTLPGSSPTPSTFFCAPGVARRSDARTGFPAAVAAQPAPHPALRARSCPHSHVGGRLHASALAFRFDPCLSSLPLCPRVQMERRCGSWDLTLSGAVPMRGELQVAGHRNSKTPQLARWPASPNPHGSEIPHYARSVNPKS